MKITGIGLDLIEIADIVRFSKDAETHFLERCFTDGELLAVGNGINRIERLAGRFAGKEAILKALGVGWGNGIAFTDVEISNCESGKPLVTLHRLLRDIANAQGISRWMLTTSHTDRYAVAAAIAISECG